MKQKRRKNISLIEKVALHYAILFCSVSAETRDRHHHMDVSFDTDENPLVLHYTD